MYIETNKNMQRYNTFRNRWVGAYLADKGIRVIPTVSWGLENTFDFCFNGIEKGSTVAVSTYMASAHGNRADQKEFFMAGYNEMLSRIKPSTIICYGTAFDEMKGDIIEVDYGETNNLSKGFFVKKTFITTFEPLHKGGGSASGQSSGNPESTWYPKNQDAKRFLGKPGEIKETFDKNGEKRLTKIGENGKASKERQFSDHRKPHQHTNPHDHEIEWINGKPKLGPPKNYPNGRVPEFKSKEVNQVYTKNKHILEYPKYDNIDEFKESLINGREIEIEWKEINFTIEYEQNETFSICEAYKPETEKHFKSIDELLELKLKTGDVLKDVVLQAEIMWRNI